MDMEHHLGIMQDLKRKFGIVLKGASTTQVEKLDENEVITKIAQAKTAAAAFKTNLARAETIVAIKRNSDTSGTNNAKNEEKEDVRSAWTSCRPLSAAESQLHGFLCVCQLTRISHNERGTDRIKNTSKIPALF